MQQPFSRKMTALALAVSLALTLGACGGDDDPVTTKPQAAPQPAQELPRRRQRRMPF